MRTLLSLILIPTALIAVSLSAIAQSTDLRPMADDSLSPGPFSVMSGEYKFPAAIDSDVMGTASTEIWAKAFWPKDLSQSRPIVFIMHGNHSTCGSGSNPRVDSSCRYSTEGVCPAGQVVVPNHEGYNYLGEHLASRGFIAVSINTNRGINCGNGEFEDEGLILARGKMFLRHIATWRDWATKGGAPASLGVPPDYFKNGVDLKNVGLVGHSRAGEGARAAFSIQRDPKSTWATLIPEIKIKAIYEIGSVDGMTTKVLDADDVAWNQLLPMCDGDVSEHAGRYPFERMISRHHETERTPKSLTFVWGANHNFFNSEWQVGDSYGCFNHKQIYGSGPTSEKQQAIAKSSIASFFSLNLRNKVYPLKSDEKSEFNPLYQTPQAIEDITHIDRTYLTSTDDSVSFVVDDFEKSAGQSSSGAPNFSSGLTDVNEGNSPRYAEITWTHADANTFTQFNLAIDGQGKDPTSFATLDFRAARSEKDASTTVPADFSIALAFDGNALSKTVPVSAYSKILGPVSRNDLFQTIRIPFSAFAPFPKGKLKGVRFIFDREQAGVINLANVRLTMQLTTDVTDVPAVLPQSTASPLLTAPSPAPSSLTAMAGFASLNQMLPAKPVIQTAVVLKTRRAPMRTSADLDHIEMSLQAETIFPVQDELAVLMMSGHPFRVSKYLNGDLDILTFSIPFTEWKKLPAQGPMQIQYGLKSPNRIWTLPNFDRTRLDER